MLLKLFNSFHNILQKILLKTVKFVYKYGGLLVQIKSISKR